VKYACISAHLDQFPVVLMCRVLNVSRSGFYKAQKRRPSARSLEDERLRVQVRAAHAKSRQRYGSPRVHEELKGNGVRTSRRRIARLMREVGLRGKHPRRHCVTTDSQHDREIAENLLDRRFAPEQAAQPDRFWVADITYVPTREGWLYLAVVIDLAIRRVVGWAMSSSLERELVLRALRMALALRRPGEGLVHHSDRGVQYACEEYRALLQLHGITVSMSRKGDCWDNAVAESFFSILERELIDDADWHTREEASRDIFEFIEVWYNRQRRHSSLGYLSPAAYEEKLLNTPTAA
jgi:putative transposase